MHARMATLAAVSFACFACWPGPGGDARAQLGVDIPQYERVEQAGMLGYLLETASRATPTGPAAQKVLNVLVAKFAKENEIVLPPLVLLLILTEGEITPATRWPIVMADRIKAEHSDLQQMHEMLNKALIGLRDAAAPAGGGVGGGIR